MEICQELQDFDRCESSPSLKHSNEWYCYRKCKYCGEGEGEAKIIKIDVDNSDELVLESLHLNEELP